MAVARSDIKDFFSEYAKALGARDIKKIAAHWGVPALVLSDDGAVAVGELGEVEAFFASSMEQYEGIATARAKIASADALSDTVVGCEIEWRHEDADGKEIGAEVGHYTLRQDGRSLKIHAYTPRPG